MRLSVLVPHRDVRGKLLAVGDQYTVGDYVAEQLIREGVVMQAPTAEAPENPTVPQEAETPVVELPPATPAALAHAEELGVDLSTVEGTGADGKITKADVAAAVSAADGV